MDFFLEIVYTHFMETFGTLTQLGECHLDVVEVVGSSPIRPTNLRRNLIKFLLFSFHRPKKRRVAQTYVLHVFLL